MSLATTEFARQARAFWENAKHARRRMREHSIHGLRWNQHSACLGAYSVGYEKLCHRHCDLFHEIATYFGDEVIWLSDYAGWQPA